ncbi:MAG: signal peptide peptidase SppA [Armatimonadota bacterium]
MDRNDDNDRFGGWGEERQEAENGGDAPDHHPPPSPPGWDDNTGPAGASRPPQQEQQPPQPPPQPPPGQYRTGGNGGGQPPKGSGPKRGPATIIIILLVLMLVGAVGVAGLFYLVSSVTGTQSAGISYGGHVGLITIPGFIHAGGRGSALFGETPGSRAVMEELRAAAKADGVKAVVLRINSPGGSAAASAAIHQEVVALAKKKPVIASFGDVAASGGYYVACGADEIVANGSTMTGSIGVIMSGVGYYGLMDKLGIVDQTLKTGKFKDTGTPLRPMRPDEKKLIEEMLDDVYEQFIDAVVEGRDLSGEKVREIADGRVMTGRQAKELGLVDSIGNFHDAVNLAAEKGGIKGEPKLKTFGPPRGLLTELLGADSLLPVPTGREAHRLQGPLLVEPGCFDQLLIDTMISRQFLRK